MTSLSTCVKNWATSSQIGDSEKIANIYSTFAFLI